MKRKRLTKQKAKLDKVAEELLTGQVVLLSSGKDSDKLSLSEKRSRAGKLGRSKQLQAFRHSDGEELSTVSTLPSNSDITRYNKALLSLEELSPAAYQVAGLRRWMVKKARRMLVANLESKNDWLRFQSVSKILELAGVFPSRKTEPQKLDVRV